MESCAKCGMEKRTAGPGSITQWISTCQCDELKFDSQDEDTAGEQILLCTVCNKRIQAGRVGSLTQWVFRSDLCACETPSPIATRKPAEPVVQSTQDTTRTYEDGFVLSQTPADPSLSIDSDSFPADRYRALSEVGRGASGIVYRAVDRMLQKEIAIKCLKSVTANELMSFQKEAQATSRLNHPNIVKIFDFGASQGGAPYMVMEYVKGISLKRLIEEQGPLSEYEALPLFLDLARALEHAHGKGVFHRDIKSSNVIVSKIAGAPAKQNVRLIDFGVAALKGVESPNGRKTVLVGTPPYMSPEQLDGAPFDARSEIYSLGCLFYEILSGSPPFVGDTALETMNMHTHREVVPLSEVKPESKFSEELESVVLRCLEKQPNERFQSMSELAIELESVIANNSTMFPSPEPDSPDTDDGVTGNRKTSVSTFAALLFGIGAVSLGVGVFLFNRLAPFRNREPAQVKLMRASDKGLMVQKALDWTPATIEKEAYFSRGERTVLTFGNDASTDRLANRPDIKNLRLVRCKIGGPGATKLATLKLQTLECDNTTFDTAALNIVGKIPTLKELVILHSAWFTGNTFRHFQNPLLEDIRTDACDIRDSSVRYFSNHKTLKKLTIVRSNNFTGAGFADLEGCPSLTTLQLIEVPALSDQCFYHIAKLRSLESFSLKDSFFVPGRTSDDVKAVLGAPDSKPYDLEAFKQIASMDKLSVLCIDADRLGDAHYDALSKMKSLNNLALVGQKFIKPENLAKLGTIQTLGILKIIGPCVESGGIKQLSVMPHIQRLLLCDCELTDRALSEFSNSNIHHLMIDGENTISGVGLDYLAKMPTLNLLRLPRTSYLTAADIKRFREKKPNCVIPDQK